MSSIEIEDVVRMSLDYFGKEVICRECGVRLVDLNKALYYKSDFVDIAFFFCGEKCVDKWNEMPFYIG